MSFMPNEVALVEIVFLRELEVENEPRTVTIDARLADSEAPPAMYCTVTSSEAVIVYMTDTAQAHATTP